jgi:hypothetical protein
MQNLIGDLYDKNSFINIKNKKKLYFIGFFIYYKYNLKY